MRLSDIMTTNVVTIAPTRPLAAAREEMRRSTIHHLIVVEDGKPIGVVSTHDRTVAPSGTVRDAMHAPTVTAAPDTTVRDAANLLRGHSIGCLAVMDDGHLVGIVTISDLLEQIGRGSIKPIEESVAWTMGRKPGRPRKER
jgi:CBS domain-containing protein